MVYSILHVNMLFSDEDNGTTKITRRFLNHESRLLSWSHTCAIIVILDLTPYLLRWEKGHWPLNDLWPQGCWGHMCDSTQGSLVQVPWKYIKVCGYSDLFAKTWIKGHWPLDDLWPHICWGHMCDSTQGSLYPRPMKIHQSMWIQWPFCFCVILALNYAPGAAAPGTAAPGADAPGAWIIWSNILSQICSRTIFECTMLQEHKANMLQDHIWMHNAPGA